ncbi:translation initiation factor eIF-2B [Diaporthe amygdali]|uniref:translation initiation factor eIF-2B n=1 Tax=Phomopsis amygdali TaxID=1214568 RepID=UPI0022FE4AF5|nr:translation initiation factor eIF-2B [Diaporthe amygdali]KAJ0119829.1 translation initiation factor eIF-2B [Diaporthe amygdali]
MASAGDGGKPALQKRSVVSSFLYKFVDEDGERKAKVALFKRSGQVRTYQHRWAVVSGSIDPEDPSPQAAAWREIREETTLTPSSLELMRQGKSYVLPDESIGREWTIYPFAFRLKDASEGGEGEKGIQLDWEHDTWAWYDPFEVEDSENFGAVPRLAESLRRVWFEKDLGLEAGAVLTNGLERLKNDHQSGARQLAGIGLEILREIVFKMDTHQPPEQWWTRVRFASWHIWKNGRESMGAAVLSVLLSALSGIEARIQRLEDKSVLRWRDAAVEELDSVIASRQDTARAISTTFSSFIKEHIASKLGQARPIKVLTVSESSTITCALREVIANTGISLDLRILESRPLFEGVSLASELSKSVPSSQFSTDEATNEPGRPRKDPIPKLQLTLYTDASSALASDDVDVVLIGADRIAESGAVSNKTGSLPAILSAKHVSPKAKIVIVSETEKVATPGAAAAHVVENNDPAQLMHAWTAGFNSERIRSAAGTIPSVAGGATVQDAYHPHHGVDEVNNDVVDVRVRNVFFEWIPPELVDIYITERGQLTVADIAKHSKTLGTEEERFFRDI